MKIFSTTILLLTMVFTNIVEASLLISPTRLAFGERDRVQTVSLINSSDKTNTYRVEWTEQKVNDNGAYQALTEEEMDTFPVASKYMRLTPRQVTLAPGERQVIKVMARRSANMQEQEYRSHLTFTALPDAPKKSTSQSGGMSMKLNLLLSYSIPVILRHGDLDVQTNIDKVELSATEQPNIKKLVVSLSRQGGMSTTGRLKAYFSPEGSDEKINVATLNGFNFFTDTNTITKTLNWHTELPKQQGTLEVLLEGEKEFSGQILAQKSLKLL
ncbi:fimbrial biogenesis chaperone [Opacimonas viscosa]|uniref:Fimbria/pilus periplasmic chaperone n=1 Tax=Opacimonas viscosa TaxID=2961944 RepID=A0AA42BNE4_9ALTE|nr:fimbria/pilus periplasmic chaperone [Opacimonas viscosa]MCP3427331.1 fimbria/pilus periplasmic chaperone [Opacimonas viscosa]